MRISGFTFLRNGSCLGYPYLESIRSALPVVDEFVIALGRGDEGDDTLDQVDSIGSEKIRIIHTEWDLDRFPGGTEYAHQTDIAKAACSGDWLLYIQGDEVLHEDDLPTLVESCERWLDHPRVDAMLFDYLHFWGDYNHVHDNHRWYKQELRIVRNDPTIHSMNDAQSFRRVRDFDGVSYKSKVGSEKLVAVHSGARIFHYGWARRPHVMSVKATAFQQHHGPGAPAARAETPEPQLFDYGPLGRIPKFVGTHPEVMRERVAAMDWSHLLDYSRGTRARRPVHPHERLKYRFITWVERAFAGGRHLFASRNYVMLDGLPLPRKVNAATPRTARG